MAILKQLDDTPLKFGKYKGKTPTDIARTNPGYIVWIYENIEIKHCTQTLYKKCLAKVNDRDALREAMCHDMEDDIGDGSWSGQGWGN